MHALSPWEGPVESFFNFIENPFSLCGASVMDDLYLLLLLGNPHTVRPTQLLWPLPKTQSSFSAGAAMTALAALQ